MKQPTLILDPSNDELTEAVRTADFRVLAAYMEKIEKGTHNTYMPEWVADKLIEYSQDLFKSSHKKNNEELFKKYVEILQPYLDAQIYSELKDILKQSNFHLSNSHENNIETKPADYSLEDILKSTYDTLLKTPIPELQEMWCVLLKNKPSADFWASQNINSHMQQITWAIKAQKGDTDNMAGKCKLPPHDEL